MHRPIDGSVIVLCERPQCLLSDDGKGSAHIIIRRIFIRESANEETVENVKGAVLLLAHFSNAKLPLIFVAIWMRNY